MFLRAKQPSTIMPALAIKHPQPNAAVLALTRAFPVLRDALAHEPEHQRALRRALAAIERETAAAGT
jgi:hypothetical protein